MIDWIVKSVNFNFLFSKVHPKFSPVGGGQHPGLSAMWKRGI